MLKWFNAKFELNNLESSNSTKRKCEIENPIDSSRNCCCICPFHLEVNATKFDADNETMSFVDFIIFKEHKFLRNIFSSEEHATTDGLKDLKTYHQTFVKFLKIIVLQIALNTLVEFSDCFNEDLPNFCRDNWADCSDFDELKETIGSVKVKNNPGFKTSKFFLQIYAFVYQKLMDFPSGQFDFHAFTVLDLFESVHRAVNVKIHLLHSKVTVNV